MKKPTGLACYIATSWENQEVFHELKKKLEAGGHSVTHDLTKEDKTKVPEDECEMYLNKCARADLLGVENADILILLAQPDMAGAYVELGYAFAADKQIILVDTSKEGVKDCLFYHLQAPSQIFRAESVDHAVSILNAAKKVTDAFFDAIQLLPKTKTSSIYGNN